MIPLWQAVLFGLPFFFWTILLSLMLGKATRLLSQCSDELKKSSEDNWRYFDSLWAIGSWASDNECDEIFEIARKALNLDISDEETSEW